MCEKKFEYKQHEAEIINFDESEIFTGLEFASDNDGDKGGTSLHSAGSSDMQHCFH